MSETSGVRSALRLLAMGAAARIGRCIALLLLLAVVVASGLACPRCVGRVVLCCAE